MTPVEKRFLTGFRSEDADTPGLVQEDDGTVWLVAPDGTRTQISGGGSSSSLPIANQAAGAEPTIDTTTYDDPYTGSGKLRVLVFPAGAPDFGDAGLLGIAKEGDAFPRVLMASDMSDGWYFGDGTVDPRSGNAMALFSTRNGDGTMVANVAAAQGDVAVGKADPGGNRGYVDTHNKGLVINLGSAGAMVTTVFGEPVCGGEVGDLAIRVDGGDGSWLYRCTVAGDAGNATWVAKL